MNVTRLSVPMIALGLTLAGCDKNDDHRTRSGDVESGGSTEPGESVRGDQGGTAGASTEDGGGQGGSGGTTAEEALVGAIDTATTAELAAAEVQAVDVVLDLKEVTHAFVEDDPTLDTALSAVENATAIHDQISDVLAEACPSIIPTHSARSASVTVEFDQCTLPGGMTVSGEVSATVERVEVGGGGELVVTFSLTDLAFGAIVVNGTLSVSTQDLTNYPLAADLDVNTLGTLSFDGEVAVSHEGTALAATLDGSGSLEPSEALLGSLPALTSGAWTCEREGATTFVVGGLHRVFANCYADDGAVSVAQSYECSLLRQTSQAEVSTSLAWNSDTPNSGEISATTRVTTGSQSSTSEPENVEIPWACQVGD